MKFVDKVLQKWRVSKTLSELSKLQGRISVLDVGCYEPVLLRRLKGKLESGTGIDPSVNAITTLESITLLPGYFPDDMPENSGKYDALCMLAVIEHMPENVLQNLDKSCASFLNKGGRVIITAPHPFVDHILEVLCKLRLIDGIALEEHHEFDVEQIPELFEGKGLFRMISRRRFQLGLNNIYVFEKL